MTRGKHPRDRRHEHSSSVVLSGGCFEILRIRDPLFVPGGCIEIVLLVRGVPVNTPPSVTRRIHDLPFLLLTLPLEPGAVVKMPLRPLISD